MNKVYLHVLNKNFDTVIMLPITRHNIKNTWLETALNEMNVKYLITGFADKDFIHCISEEEFVKNNRFFVEKK